jgi:hypothetical protein
MHKQNFSQQFVREKALHHYITAFERGDFDVMDEVLQQAMTDPLLDEMIMEAHEYFQGEEKAALREEDVAKILDLVIQHLPSGIPDEEEESGSVPPLTVSDVFTSMQEDSTLPGFLRQEAQRIHARLPSTPPQLPEQLGLKDVAQLFADLNIQISARLQKVFREKAIFLAMGHQRGMAQLAAARRQRTKHRPEQKTGKETH